ncbi:DoxX-like family protein [Acidovorax sp. 106]|uniref:DoxX-like family protein n=1 Tax=Acidovorax sp. 106 TaxID=2135637 RepID=UPI000EAB96A1|nr:DoxX-like family protein [Acidovorax sp. 106]RLJ39014.1 DoxX-like protein [Acidovorax sp. 106]
MTPSVHPQAPLPTPTVPAVRLLRASLVTVWLGTAVVSAITHRTQGDALLRQAGLSDDLWIQALIWGGAAADLLMGLALWRWPGRYSAWAALALMGVMTLTATVLLPHLWLDPLGSLLKNLPIAAILVVLATQHEPTQTTSTA